MLEVTVIYNKTEAGLAEMQSRARGLRAELHLLLILIDGSSPISRLATFVRGSKVASLIFELETQGLIMSPTTHCFRKTEAGVLEIQKRALGLRPELRRLLIVVDGRTALPRLASFVPNLPILDLIAELENARLIVAPNTAGATIRAVVAPVAVPNQAPLPETHRARVMPEPVVARAHLTDERVQIVRTVPSRGLGRILGVNSHEWQDKLQQPGDSLALRAVIAEIIRHSKSNLASRQVNSFWIACVVLPTTAAIWQTDFRCKRLVTTR